MNDINPLISLTIKYFNRGLVSKETVVLSAHAPISQFLLGLHSEWYDITDFTIVHLSPNFYEGHGFVLIVVGLCYPC